MLSRRDMAPVRITLCGSFQVLGVSFMLVSLCGSEKSDYFNHPMINFGGFFDVSFPNGTIDRFLDFLCDTTIVHCRITFELVDSLTIRYGFPYYYNVTRFVQYRGEPSDKSYYNSNVICSPMRHRRKDHIDCFRLPRDDKTCERHSCIHMSVQQQNRKCSLNCTMVYLLGDFLPKMHYINFGSRPLFNKGGVCPSYGVSSESARVISTTVSTTTENTASLSTDRYGSSAAGDNHENWTTQNITRNVKEKSGPGILSPATLWTGGTCLILVVACAVGIFIHHRRREKDEAVDLQVNQALDSSLLTHIQMNSSTTDMTKEEETDEPSYHTIDEMTMVSAQVTQFQHTDDIGYTTILD